MVVGVFKLPAYPSIQYRKNLSSSQISSLYKTIASTLNNAVSLPPQQRDYPSTRRYVAAYAQDVAFQVLQNIIWKDNSTRAQSADEELLSNHSLRLAEQLASIAQGLDMDVLVDLSIIYARGHISQLHAVFAAAFKSNPNLPLSIANDLVPSFIQLLSQQSPSSQGLYGQRKVAECVYTFLRACKGIPELVRPFAHHKEFILALATQYGAGLTAISTAYGGTPALVAGISAQNREPDDWERMWIETKVALIDSFHIVFSALVNDIASATPGPRPSSIEADRAFEVVFALLEQPNPASSTSDSLLTPFLDQSLSADYHHTYDLSKTLVSALKHTAEKDERLDLLESMLKPSNSNPGQKRDAGALKILLQSSGIQPGKDKPGTQTTTDQATSSVPPFVSTKDKGKGRAAPPPTTVSDPDLDIKATQVLDILPDMSLNHIRLLLSHDKYGGNPETVIEALLEGTAMNEEELEEDLRNTNQISIDQALMQGKPGRRDLSERRNVFDKDALDLSRLRLGKKDVGNELQKDHSFIKQMKADILRRAQEMSDEDEDDYPFPQFTGPSNSKSKIKGAVNRDDFDSDYDEVPVRLRVGGDGEDTDDDGSQGEQETQSPQTIIELAYLRDPELFERDAATRRSKGRAALRIQTGWADEQIEGWKVMLDRTTGGKNKLEVKHAFIGNEKGLVVHPVDDGRGRGRGRGRSRGRGRGGTGESTQGHDRAWKEKNKAGRANHNRKKGHDKKMARAGAGPSNA